MGVGVIEAEPERTQRARAAAELALVRIVHQYGGRPEFVLLGGLVPGLLCAGSALPHAGTTDVDVQVDLEIAGGAVHAVRLERALKNADFEPDDERTWRWKAPGGSPHAVIKFELLADRSDQPAGASVDFDGCEHLGAANLRGTGFAARDIEVRQLQAKDGGVLRTVEVNVAGLAGFLLAKTAAAHGRRKPKDWYDVAYVLLHNDAGGVEAAARVVLARFGAELAILKTALVDLAANFVDEEAQGPSAYAAQATLDDPSLDIAIAAADAQLAVSRFCALLLAAV